MFKMLVFQQHFDLC